ncbi:hypothetical protein R1sor_015996 [Riccia sorocarpa]|uniref:Protein preY, mitochondrial n=1 Tax=Riccia sorocarpa TaxID=122646 RepID=A0ABD3HDS7_9MARC
MSSSGAVKFVKGVTFDPKILQFIVCPLTKQPLRYCKESQELFSDSIGVAYPIKEGIPCLAPLSGRVVDSVDPKNSP